jgi:flavin-dependent dehydrogenase
MHSESPRHVITVIGSSVTGSLAAAYLARHHPDCKVNLIHHHEPKRPIVGESLTEFSTQMLHELGLSSYLEEEHYHKYGLTFYFKEDLSKPECRTYAVHEALAIPPLPSNQLNRFTFDEKIRQVAIDNGAVVHHGRATTIELIENGQHIVSVSTESGPLRLESDWIIDASGRNRIIAKKLNLHQDAPYQRCSFWFRLVNFDRSILSNLNAIKPKQQAFDSYFATHHFMGKGNWIWCIPMRTPDYDDMISIGIVWRPDILEKNITSLEAFYEQVDAEHPVVAELVRSGEIHDIKVYRNYMYETKQVYSKDGWYLIGDAADTVDPLYSTGLVMTSIQVKQVSTMIDHEKRGLLTEGLVHDMQHAFKTLKNTMQGEIGRYYEVMDDPYQAHWRMHIISTYYFFFLLPCFLCNYMSSRFGARFIAQTIESGGQRYGSLLSLLPLGAKRLGTVQAKHLVNHYDRSVNWLLWKGDEKLLGGYISTLWLRFASYRFELLKNAGWKNIGEHIRYAIGDLVSALRWKLLYSGKELSKPEVLGWQVLPPSTDRVVSRLAGGNTTTPSDISAAPNERLPLNEGGERLSEHSHPHEANGLCQADNPSSL